MSKAGKGDSVDTGAVGSQHPVPENIPHLSSPNGNGQQQHHPSLSTGHSQGSNGSNGNGNANNANNGGNSASGSPVKEASFLHRETSATSDEDNKNNINAENNNNNESEVSAAAAGTNDAQAQAIPIRR